MEKPQYSTHQEWYKANRRSLKIYRGQWIAITKDGVIAHHQDFSEMRKSIDPNLPISDYVITRIFENEFIEPVKFHAVRFRTFKGHDWQPLYDINLKFHNSVPLKMLVDSGSEVSLINKQLGIDLGYTKSDGEKVWQGEGVGGVVEYLMREVEMTIDSHSFIAPIAWLQTENCQEVLLGRDVVFDLFDIEFKQAEETIIFKLR